MSFGTYRVVANRSKHNGRVELERPGWTWICSCGEHGKHYDYQYLAYENLDDEHYKIKRGRILNRGWNGDWAVNNCERLRSFCVIKGCDAEVTALGLCNAHYLRFHRNHYFGRKAEKAPRTCHVCGSNKLWLQYLYCRKHYNEKQNEYYHKTWKNKLKV